MGQDEEKNDEEDADMQLVGQRLQRIIGVRRSPRAATLGPPAHTHTFSTYFPTAVSVFGPLQFAIPNSPAMLFGEYGKQCLQQRMCKVKVNRSFVWKEAPANVRRAAWPTTTLEHAKEYLSS